MLPYHLQTMHSYMSVRNGGHVMDWEHQPDAFKVYPSSYPRLFLDRNNPHHRFLILIGGITAKKSYPGVTYALRTNPSAGALYPTETYVQIKGVEGFEEGIYHLSPSEQALVLLTPLNPQEGLETFLHVRNIQGFCFFFSALYYRSSWKYRDRAFRYCLHDTGHMLGALEASCQYYEKTYRIVYAIDKIALNRLFGFGKEEFFLSAAIVGNEHDEDVRALEKTLKTCDGTHYFEENTLIEKTYASTMNVRQKPQTTVPYFELEKESFLKTIWQRRSARGFDTSQTITQEAFEHVMAFITEPIPSDCDCRIEIYAVINRVEGMRLGIWKEGAYLAFGDFAAKAGYLCLEQALGAHSAVTFFLVSEKDENYQASVQKAGIIGHRLYLISNYHGIGCSGIGAYYDEEVVEFLQTQGMILYALAIGYALVSE
jgi:SagB-type dehydrogenase family enzyme